MKKLIRLAMIGLVLAVMACNTMPAAQAQTSPNFIQGQIPSAAQWKQYFADKQDTLGYRPASKGGDVMLGLLRYSMAAPSVGGCGTNPSVRGNNQAGEVTMGTGSPTGCVITFAAANPWSAIPTCTVTWQANLASMGYTITKSALTLTQTGTSSNKVNWHCDGLQ